MFTFLTLVLCRVLDLVGKAIDDDGKTRRFVAIALTLAAVYMLLGVAV